MKITVKSRTDNLKLLSWDKIEVIHPLPDKEICGISIEAWDGDVAQAKIYYYGKCPSFSDKELFDIGIYGSGEEKLQNGQDVFYIKCPLAI